MASCQRVLLSGVIVSFLVAFVGVSSQVTSVPPYVKQCPRKDPKLVDCFIAALHHLKPYLANGIPEIEMPSVEPFRLDELSLALTTGPNGYKVTLREIDVFGLSNYNVTQLKLTDGDEPFESKIWLPDLKITAKYMSSGVLIILPASGNGTFHATLGDVLAGIKGKVSFHKRNGLDYLHADTMDMDLNIKVVRMMVRKVFNNNKILAEATNLFLQENGHEVLKAMMPQLRQKLTEVVLKIVNNLLTHVPTQTFFASQ